MDREEFLGIPELAHELRRKELRLEFMRTRAEGDGALQLRERVQTSGDKTVQEAIAAAMSDLSREVDELREELHYKRMRAEKLIDQLDGEERDLMRLHYLRGLTWLECTEVMVYDRSTVYRRQQTAIERLFGPDPDA